MPLRLGHRRAAPGRRRHEGRDGAASSGGHRAGDGSETAAGPDQPLDEAGFPLLRAATLYTLGTDAWDVAIFGDDDPPAGHDPDSPADASSQPGDQDSRPADTISLLRAATLYTLGADLDGPYQPGDDEDDVDLDVLDDLVPPPLPAPARRPGRRQHRRRGRRPRVLVAAAFVLLVTAAGSGLPRLRDTPARELTTTAPTTAPTTTPSPLELSRPTTAPVLGEVAVPPLPGTTTTVPATSVAPAPARTGSTAPATTTSTTAAVPTTAIAPVPTTTVPPEPATSTPPAPTTSTTAPVTTTTTQPPAPTTTSSTSTTSTSAVP